MIVDVVEVNVVLGAVMGSLVVDAVVMDVIMGLGMHSLYLVSLRGGREGNCSTCSINTSKSRCK